MINKELEIGLQQLIDDRIQVAMRHATPSKNILTIKEVMERYMQARVITILSLMEVA